MRRSLALIAGLMLVLTLWTGVSTSAVHAAEIVGCAELSVDVEAHAPGHAGKVPGGSDNPVPHHHGSCHSHFLSLPALDNLDAVASIARTRWRIGSTIDSESIAIASDLRPPIA